MKGSSLDQHCTALSSSASRHGWGVVQEVLDQVAAELEQEEELRAQHARDKKQVTCITTCMRQVKCMEMNNHSPNMAPVMS